MPLAWRNAIGKSARMKQSGLVERSQCRAYSLGPPVADVIVGQHGDIYPGTAHRAGQRIGRAEAGITGIRLLSERRLQIGNDEIGARKIVVQPGKTGGIVERTVPLPGGEHLRHVLHQVARKDQRQASPTVFRKRFRPRGRHSLLPAGRTAEENERESAPCREKRSIAHCTAFAIFVFAKLIIFTYVNSYWVDIHTHRPLDGRPGIRSLRIGTDFPDSTDGKISAGIHPWDAERAQREWLDGIRELQPAAVGEVGLDYATDIDREAQRTWLARQRDLAAELGLPLVVHCVRAYDDLKAMLSGFPLPVIVHGFTGSEQLASQLLDRGWYLSFGKTVERSPKTRRTLRSIPSDRLFLETDMSGEEIESVYRRAADIRNEPAESLRDAVHTNYLNLFGL